MSEADVQESAVIGEGEGPAQAQGKRKLDAGASRNIRFVAGALGVGLLVIFATVYFFAGGGSAESRSGSDIKIGNTTNQTNEGLTPAMREKLARAQAQEATQAARQGESYIPPDVLPSTPNQPMLTPEAQSRAYEAEAQANAAAVQAVNERNQLRLAAAQQMLAATLTRQEVERVSITKSSEANAQQSVAAPGVASPASAAGEDGVLIADMMEIFGARLVSPVDTDSTTFASAEITTGKLAGAYLIGQVRLAGEGVQFEFTGMRHNNATYPISAIALDQATSTSAIQGDLDRKLLQRYVFPVLMAYGGAYATAKAQVAQTVTPLSGGVPISTAPSGLAGGVLGGGGASSNSLLGAIGGASQGYSEYGVTRPAPTSAQARAAGVAAAVGVGNNVTSKLAAEPVRVSMANGMSIGIMFRAPVRSSSAAATR